MAGNMADNGDEKKARASTPADQEEGEGTLELVMPKPPDGGWGWVIVGASLMANIIVDGITYTFGIFLPRFAEAFNEPKGTIALAGSLQVGTYLCVGPIVSALTNRWGCKKVTMVGSVVATIGFILSVFAPTVEILIVTYGIIGGFGFGMMYLPAIVIVGYYFERRRALATGIAVCGSGVGMFVMAPLSDLLLHEFGYKGALLVIAGLVFNGVICGALMRPLPVAQVQSTIIEQQDEEPEVTEPLMKTPQKNGSDVKPEAVSPPPPIVILDEGRPPGKGAREEFAFFSVPNMVYASTKDPKPAFPGLRQRSNTLNAVDKICLRHVGKEIVPEHPKPSCTPIGLSYIGLSDAQVNRVRATANVNVSRRDIFMSGTKLHIPDQSLWRSAVSMRSVQTEAERVLCACVPESARDTLLQMLDFSILRNKAYVLILVGNVFAMLGFYVPFVFMPEKALSHGISEAQAAYLLSIIGITNTVGRVLTGVLANMNKIDSLVINNIAMLLCGLATFVTPFCTHYVMLCIAAAVFGLCVAAYISLSSILLCDMLMMMMLHPAVRHADDGDDDDDDDDDDNNDDNNDDDDDDSDDDDDVSAAYISLSSILLCDMLGVEQLTNAFGFLTLARGVSSCAGSPLAGAIIDRTQNVDLAFYVGGVLIVVGSLFHFLLHTPCVRQDKKSRTDSDPQA
ncbi:hypothetical protein ACOMHN_066616 [Nucella lapillus]